MASKARCRVCGVYAVWRYGTLVLYCLPNCPMDWEDIQGILDRADRMYEGGAEALIQFWASEWNRLDKNVK